jgi:hypothetical protein
MSVSPFSDMEIFWGEKTGDRSQELQNAEVNSLGKRILGRYLDVSARFSS